MPTEAGAGTVISVRDETGAEVNLSEAGRILESRELSISFDRETPSDAFNSDSTTLPAGIGDSPDEVEIWVHPVGAAHCKLDAVIVPLGEQVRAFSILLRRAGEGEYDRLMFR